jgi:hypothetical protein
MNPTFSGVTKGRSTDSFDSDFVERGRRRAMAENGNEPPQKPRLTHVETKRQKAKLARADVAKARKAGTDESAISLSADQVAIIFLCQRGYQTLVSLLQGVNSTRIPVGKNPIDEKTILPMLKELEDQGYLTKSTIQDQPAWTVTGKADELEL